VYFLRGRGASRLDAFQKESVHTLINKNQQADSFFLYDSEAVKRQLTGWKARLPWIRPFYAMKSNPLPSIIRDAVAAGCGLDCASQTELATAIEHGLSPADIVYSNVVKTEKDLIAAHALGI
jgi:ornithine decarboxylase